MTGKFSEYTMILKIRNLKVSKHLIGQFNTLTLSGLFWPCRCRSGVVKWALLSAPNGKTLAQINEKIPWPKSVLLLQIDIVNAEVKLLGVGQNKNNPKHTQ